MKILPRNKIGKDCLDSSKFEDSHFRAAKISNCLIHCQNWVTLMSEFEMIELKRTEPTSNESIKNLHG